MHCDIATRYRLYIFEILYCLLGILEIPLVCIIMLGYLSSVFSLIGARVVLMSVLMCSIRPVEQLDGGLSTG